VGSVVKVDEEGVRVVVPDRLLGIYRPTGESEPLGPPLGSDLELVVASHDRAGRRLELIAAGDVQVGT
jgi:hypothetical protein